MAPWSLGNHISWKSDSLAKSMRAREAEICWELFQPTRMTLKTRGVRTDGALFGKWAGALSQSHPVLLSEAGSVRKKTLWSFAQKGRAPCPGVCIMPQPYFERLYTPLTFVTPACSYWLVSRYHLTFGELLCKVVLIFASWVLHTGPRSWWLYNVCLRRNTVHNLAPGPGTRAWWLTHSSSSGLQDTDKVSNGRSVVQLLVIVSPATVT